MAASSNRVERGRPIALFLALTIAFSAIFWALAIATGRTAGGHGLYAVGVMWCPGVAALLTCRLSGISYSGLGWNWGPARYSLVGYLVPLGYAAIGYGLVWASGLGGAIDPVFIDKTRQSLAWPHAPDWAVVAGWFLLLGTVGVISTCVNTLGEELGWRGFLAPRLVERYGFTRGALLLGAIHGVWHLPLLLFADYNEGTPWWFGMGCFFVGIMGISVVMTWLRLRSGSLWPAVLVHASHNSFVQGFFTPATIRHAVTPYVIDEFGIVLPVMIALVGFGFWMRRGELPSAASRGFGRLSESHDREHGPAAARLGGAP